MISLLSVDDIAEGTSVGIEINNHYLFAVKKDDQIFVYWNRCPHLGTPLEWEENRFLDSEGALIQCSTHGALFQIEDGHCLVGPCRGKNLQPVPFTVSNGEVLVNKALLKPPSTS